MERLSDLYTFRSFQTMTSSMFYSDCSLVPRKIWGRLPKYFLIRVAYKNIQGDVF